MKSAFEGGDYCTVAWYISIEEIFCCGNYHSRPHPHVLETGGGATVYEHMVNIP